MNDAASEREELLSRLNGTVSQAVQFFADIDGRFFDGHQNAYEVISHLVFWHREYCSITQALLDNRKLSLKKGSLAELNAQAANEFQTSSMPELAACLADYQDKLSDNLRQLPNWDVNFPFKLGCRKTNVSGRIASIESHIRQHLTRQQRARQRGEAWIKAYYP